MSSQEVVDHLVRLPKGQREKLYKLALSVSRNTGASAYDAIHMILLMRLSNRGYK